MDNVSLFDIIGPVMIGPSSSHTAGAVRLGLLARCVAGRPIKMARLQLFNSFSKTYQGHGTDRGLLSGLLGYAVDDERLREAPELAKQAGLAYEFIPKGDDLQLPPNTVIFDLILENDEEIKMTGHSIGGGKVFVSKINGYQVNLKGDYPTLVMFYHDRPGMIWKVTKEIAEQEINIASLLCSRKDKGQEAFMAICLDSLLPEESVNRIQQIDGVHYVRNVDKLPQ